MVPKIRVIGWAVLVGAFLVPSLAAAQAPPHRQNRVAPKKEQSGPKDCVSTRATTGQGADATAPEGQALSRQLARSNGVICPPPTDPEMKKPAPGGGTMPVIPPPDGKRGIEPK
jgi:hypothetical protein